MKKIKNLALIDAIIAASSINNNNTFELKACHQFDTPSVDLSKQKCNFREKGPQSKDRWQ
jgi:hypothetical protein